VILPLFIRLVRGAGWFLLAAGAGVVACVGMSECLGGPVEGQSAWPAPKMWRSLLTSLAVAGGATGLSFCLGLPAAVGLVHARRRWRHGLLLSMTCLPLVTMPSIFAYAWLLLASPRPGSRGPLTALSAGLDRLGWNTPGLETVQTAWVLATWLWPIPALLLSGAFRHLASVPYVMARLDASPVRAFTAGAWPLLRPAAVAAGAIVLLLALTDSTVGPLMNASGLWAVELLAQAAIAPRYDRPVAYLFWQAWPMLAVICFIAAVAWRSLRRMTAWAEDSGGADLGALAGTSPWTWRVAFLVPVSVTVLPIVVFCLELAGGRTTPGQAMRTAWTTLSGSGAATFLAAVGAGAAAVAICTALLDEDTWPRPRRALARAAVGLTLACAVVPPELSGAALVSFYSRISDPAKWNVYDHTPLVWILGLAVRFSFLTVCVGRWLNRRVPPERIAAASVDGAGPMARLACIRLPMLRDSLAAAAMMTACLGMSEVAVSVLIQPPRFFGGSLAVEVDSQMHYGRQNETIAASLMLLLPAMAAAAVVPWIRRKEWR
jgi:ABC-type Fe3+ transport system permease subunit